MTFHDKISNIMKRIFYFIFVIGMTIPAYAKLSATQFPMTAQDLSFKSRVEIATEGYKPFLDKKAYQELNIVPGEEIYTDSMIAKIEATEKQQKQDAQNLPHDKYCAKYPDDETVCKPAQPVQPDTHEPVQPNAQNQPTVPQKTKPEQNQIYFSGRTIGGGSVIENNYVVGNSCYPAAKDRHFPNIIYTTGKYENIHPAFEKGLITVFRKEGGCGTIKNDPCGYTCYGIGSSPKCSGVVVRSRAEAEEIYYNRYWKNYRIDKLPDVIATDIFLACMASGPGTALSQFRKFLGLPKKTSAVDNEMINAVNNYKSDIHNDWMDYRDKFLQDVARRRYNGSVSRGYKNSIELKRKNGCHVRPSEPLYR